MRKRSASRALLTTCLLSAIAISGCREKPDIAWSQQVNSPDGHWSVITHGEAGGSFGGGYEATIVSLKQAGQEPIEVLGFDHLYSEQTIHPKWIGPRHLEVITDTTPTPNEITFEAVKCGDVTVSFVAAK